MLGKRKVLENWNSDNMKIKQEQDCSSLDSIYNKRLSDLFEQWMKSFFNIYMIGKYYSSFSPVKLN